MEHATSNHALNRVLTYRHPGVCRKLVEELGYAPEAAERLFIDTLRFLSLAGDQKTRATTMALAVDMGYTVNRIHVCIAPTRAIDEAWHRFVLFTHDYARFCVQHFGKFLHHQPIANPEQLEEVVRGDDLIRIARDVYGAELDLTNWQGDSTNSGTCCVNCSECMDERNHCHACCECAVCTAFHPRLIAASRNLVDAQNRLCGERNAINRPAAALETNIHKKNDAHQTLRTQLEDRRRRVLALQQHIAEDTCIIQMLERTIADLQEQLTVVREEVKRRRDDRLPRIDALVCKAQDAYDRLIAEHRAAIEQPTKRS